MMTEILGEDHIKTQMQVQHNMKNQSRNITIGSWNLQCQMIGSLNFQQHFNGRNDQIQIFNQLNYKVGRNLLVNRFQSLNNEIK